MSGHAIGAPLAGQGFSPLTRHGLIHKALTLSNFFNISTIEQYPEILEQTPQKPVHNPAIKTVQSTFLTLQFKQADPFDITWMKPQKYGIIRVYSWKNAYAVHKAGSKDDILFIREPDAHIYETLTTAELDQYLSPCTDSQRALYIELREVLEDIKIGAYRMIDLSTHIDNNSGTGDLSEVGDMSAEGVGIREDYDTSEY